MAYTVTTKGDDATVIGTSSADSLLAAATGDFDGDITVSSQEGNDNLELSGTATSGNVGMGGGVDTVTITGVTKAVTFTLGDSTDFFSSTVADEGITVGGQGGADTFTVNNAGATKNRYAGGQGKDTFTITAAGASNTIVGGSEDDTFTVTAATTKTFVNGQIGEDTITVAAGGAVGGTATIRGGSEDDTITFNSVTDKNLLAGDNGADKITDVGGDNTLLGGGGADTLTGGVGQDTLNGGAGADRLVINEKQSGGTDVKSIDDFDAGETIKVNTLELVQGFESSDKIATGNGTSVKNATTVEADGGALQAATSYFVYGSYTGAGNFVVSTDGADALVYVGTNIVAAGDLDADNYFVVEGGGSTVSTSNFVAS